MTNILYLSMAKYNRNNVATYNECVIINMGKPELFLIGE
jgi:hypothetical protein